MKLQAYSIFDVKVGIFMRPFFQQADGQAKRTFSDIANDDSHEIGKHPEDYSLHRVGDFNDQNGTLQGEVPEQLMTALEARHAHRKVNGAQLDAFERDVVESGEFPLLTEQAE